MLAYLLENWPFIWEHTREHIEIVLIASAIAISIGIPLGILVTRITWLEQPVLGSAQVLYTVPTIALFAILIPILGLGRESAIFALVMYTQVPLIRNTVIGINEVDDALIETANGMGMTRLQRLVRVEIPIALPVILAGVRTMAVLIVATTALASLIGAGGLGDIIFQGMNQRFFAKIAVATLLISLIAIVLDSLLASLQRWFRSGMGAGTWAR